MRPPRVLVLAQTPPPLHGQAVMGGYLVSARWRWCTLEHIRLDYSDSIEEVGRRDPRKVLRLLRIVLRVWRARLRGPIDLLCYPPAGPHRVPVARDILTLLLVRWTARRVAFHFHAGGFDRVPSLVGAAFRPLVRMAYGAPDLAVVPAPALAGEIAWIHPRSVAAVPNGVPPLIGRTRPPRRNHRMLYVGTLSEEKGVLDLVEAFRILKAEGRGAVLVLAGAPVSRSFARRLNERLDAHGLRTCVELRGVVQGTDKEDEFASAGIFCFPTRDVEAMPLVLLEAMRAGLPIVTTRWRAIPEIVRGAAILVPPGDIQALASALGELLDRGDVRNALGAEALRIFASEFTLDRHLEAMEKAFRQAAAREEGR